MIIPEPTVGALRHRGRRKEQARCWKFLGVLGSGPSGALVEPTTMTTWRNLVNVPPLQGVVTKGQLSGRLSVCGFKSRRDLLPTLLE